jgi:hypothetical protein
MLVRVFPKALGTGTNKAASSAYILYKDNSALRSAPVMRSEVQVDVDQAAAAGVKPGHYWSVNSSGKERARSDEEDLIIQYPGQIAMTPFTPERVESSHSGR